MVRRLNNVRRIPKTWLHAQFACHTLQVRHFDSNGPKCLVSSNIWWSMLYSLCPRWLQDTVHSYVGLCSADAMLRCSLFALPKVVLSHQISQSWEVYCVHAGLRLAEHIEASNSPHLLPVSLLTGAGLASQISGFANQKLLHVASVRSRANQSRTQSRHKPHKGAISPISGS